MTRPSVPAAIRRAVLEESGYRCAVPHCRAETLEIAHITAWADTHDHSFDNLIALCPNCHTRYDQRKDIPKASILQFKANLSILNGRYGEFERRVIQLFADEPDSNTIQLAGGGDLTRIQLMNLLKDGMLVEGPAVGGAQIKIGGASMVVAFVLTERGRQLVERWKTAQPIG